MYRYTEELYNKFVPSTAFFPSSSMLHNFSFLHLARVCVQSQMARDQVEEEQALKLEILQLSSGTACFGTAQNKNKNNYAFESRNILHG